MEIIYKVKGPALNYRSEPNLQATVRGSFSQNTDVTITEIKKDSSGGTWGKHSKGWISIVGASGTIYMTKVSTVSAPATTKTPAQTKAEKPKEKPKNEVTTKSVSYNITAGTEFKLKSARSILGLPSQFTKFADPKVGGSAFGRSYTNDILLDMPLCMITPGRPKFLDGGPVTKTTPTTPIGWLDVLINGSGSSVSGKSMGDILNDLLDGRVARYYSFQTAYAEYIQYVNSLNNVMAMYLGIGNKKGTSKIQRYSTLDWQDINNMEFVKGGLLDFIGNSGTVPFYFDKGGTSTSESASNSTDRSALDGVLQSASSMAKEAAFVTNSFAGSFNPFKTNSDLAASKIANLSTDLVSSSNMVEQIMANLKSGFTTVASGGNLLLPEIWRDSSFSRSYSLDFHFATPYGTPEAYYLNIAVPLSYLLALVLPVQFGTNGYSAPFVIQAFAQGVFNCSLGIVDSISISKFGSGDAISRSGLPLEVKVQVSFKDLYNSLSLTKHNDIAMFANNIELIDYIATMSGVNLNEPDVDRKIKLFINSKMQTITDAPGNVKMKIMDIIRNGLLGLVKY